MSYTDVQFNLLSMSKMDRADENVIFHKEGVRIVQGDKTIIHLNIVNNLVVAEIEVGIEILYLVAHSYKTI